MKALVVEDDFTSRLIMQKTLEDRGDVHIAINGYEAIEAFRSALRNETPYKLVCLDSMMPGIDGNNVLKEMRSIEEELGISRQDKVKIILTTALRDGHDLLESLRVRCDAFLVKPINRVELRKTITELSL